MSGVAIMTPPPSTRFRAKLEKRSDEGTCPYEGGGKRSSSFLRLAGVRRNDEIAVGPRVDPALRAGRGLDRLRYPRRGAGRPSRVQPPPPPRLLPPHPP